MNLKNIHEFQILLLCHVYSILQKPFTFKVQYLKGLKIIIEIVTLNWKNYDLGYGLTPPVLNDIGFVLYESSF